MLPNLNLNGYHYQKFKFHFNCNAHTAKNPMDSVGHRAALYFRTLCCKSKDICHLVKWHMFEWRPRKVYNFSKLPYSCRKAIEWIKILLKGEERDASVNGCSISFRRAVKRDVVALVTVATVVVGSSGAENLLPKTLLPVNIKTQINKKFLSYEF